MNRKEEAAFQYNLQLDVYKRWEAYQYFERYIDAHLTLFSNRNEKVELAEMFRNPDRYQGQRDFVLIGGTSYDLPERRIIDINEDLVPLIEDTKPNYNKLRLKYPVMFINQKFYIDEFIINGFLLVDVNEVNRLNKIIKLERNYECDIRVLAVILNTKDEYEFYTIRPLVPDKDIKETSKNYADTSKEEKDMRKLSKKLNSFASNLIQIMINEDKNIQHINIPESRERNIKRIKRGKPCIRGVTVLRVGGTLKRYASQYASMRNNINVRYYVGGFWRHYNSDFYVNKKGTIEWIYPHYRNDDAKTTKVSQKVLLKMGPDFRK